MRRAYGSLIICTLFAALLVLNAPASAHHKPGHDKGPPKHGKEYKNTKPGKKALRRGGPPPWAPAHGYRNKHTYKSAKDGRIRGFIPDDLIRISELGFGKCDRATIGAVLGAAAGGVFGSKFGKGDGKILASVGGAIIGALVGGNIGRAMDQVDQNCVGQILERAPTGSPVTWEDPDQRSTYTVTPTKTYQRSDGRYCREFQTKIVIDGRMQDAFGTACRQPDGSWEKSA